MSALLDRYKDRARAFIDAYDYDYCTDCGGTLNFDATLLAIIRTSTLGQHLKGLLLAEIEEERVTQEAERERLRKIAWDELSPEEQARRTAFQHSMQSLSKLIDRSYVTTILFDEIPKLDFIAQSGGKMEIIPSPNKGLYTE